MTTRVNRLTITDIEKALATPVSVAFIIVMVMTRDSGQHSRPTTFDRLEILIRKTTKQLPSVADRGQTDCVTGFAVFRS